MKLFNALLLASTLEVQVLTCMEQPVINYQMALLKMTSQSVDSIDRDFARQGYRLFNLWEEFWNQCPEAKEQDFKNEQRFYAIFKQDRAYAVRLRTHMYNVLVTQSILLTALRDRKDTKAITEAQYQHAEKVKDFLRFENATFIQCADFGELFSENRLRMHKNLSNLTCEFLADAYTRPFLRNLTTCDKDEFDRLNKIINQTLYLLCPAKNKNPAKLLKKTVTKAREMLAKQPVPLAAKTS